MKKSLIVLLLGLTLVGCGSNTAVATNTTEVSTKNGYDNSQVDKSNIGINTKQGLLDKKLNVNELLEAPKTSVQPLEVDKDLVDVSADKYITSIKDVINNSSSWFAAISRKGVTYIESLDDWTSGAYYDGQGFLITINESGDCLLNTIVGDDVEYYKLEKPESKHSKVKADEKYESFNLYGTVNIFNKDYVIVEAQTPNEVRDYYFLDKGDATCKFMSRSVEDAASLIVITSDFNTGVFEKQAKEHYTEISEEEFIEKVAEAATNLSNIVTKEHNNEKSN